MRQVFQILDGSPFFHQNKSCLYQEHFRGNAHEDIIWLYGKLLSLIKLSIIHYHPGGVLPEKLGRGVPAGSQNPYPIYDQNLRFSLPYLWPDQKFDSLFMTWLLNLLPVSDL